MFKLAERRGGRDGLYCGRDGVYLGSAALIECRDGHYWLRAEDEVAALLAAAYETPPDVARFLSGLHRVGAALQENDLGRAMIATVQLQVDAISEQNEAQLVGIDKLTKNNFNPLEPRDWHGRWAGEGLEGMALPPVGAGISEPRLGRCRRIGAVRRGADQRSNCLRRGVLVQSCRASDGEWAGFRCERDERGHAEGSAGHGGHGSPC